MQVNWPKLNTPAAGQEGMQEALTHAYKDKIIGPLLARGSGTRARNISLNRIGVMEEGKKRIE